MHKALEQAKAGHGQIVGVMGEPGLGKSRLFHEFVGAYCNTPLHSQATCLVLRSLLRLVWQSLPISAAD